MFSNLCMCVLVLVCSVAVVIVSKNENSLMRPNLKLTFHWEFAVHSAKPVDRDQDSHYVGVIIALLTTIILLLVAAIMFIVSRNKRSPRSDVLNSLQNNFNQDTLGLGIDKRHHMKVSYQIEN